LSIFGNSIQKVQVTLNSDKKNRHFTWTYKYVYDNLSLSYSQN
jgi:hypothetical protein